MAPPKLTATSRYVPEGTRKIYWTPTIAAYPSAPTRSELNAGYDLSDEIAEMAGFTVSSDQVDVPDLSSRFTAKIPGRITAADSTITFYASSTSNDVRAVLPRDTAGYVSCLWEGDVAGQKMDIFPVKVGSSSVQTGIDDPGRIEVAFAITRAPAQNLSIPA
jgi:hypothetical protein